MFPLKSSGDSSARIMFIGESPSGNDLKAGQPFMGSSGNEFSLMLHEAGILRSEVYLTYACKHMPFRGDMKSHFTKMTKLTWIPKDILIKGITDLWEEIERVQPNVIVPLGNVALWAVTGIKQAGKYRGSVMESDPVLPSIKQSRVFKVIPTYNPSVVMRMWSWRHIAVQDFRRVATEQAFPEIKIPDYIFHIRPSFKQAIDFLDHIQHDYPDEQNISVDIETIARHIACVGYGASTREAMCIPIMCRDDERGYWSATEELAIVQKQREVLRTKNILGQNFNYDAQYLFRHWCVRPKHTNDLMIAWHTMYPGERKSLDYISSLVLPYYAYWKDELKDYKNYPLNEENFWIYNCKDIVNTYESFELIYPMVTAQNLSEQYRFQMDLHMPVLDMMLRGTKIDIEKKNNLGFELLNTMTEYDNLFDSILPAKWLKPKAKSPWWNSPKQLSELFYDVLRLPIQKHKKTKKPTTDDAALEALKQQEPILKLLFQYLQEYRSVGVFKNNFIDTRVENDNRMRCTFSIPGTETFRFSSSEDAFGYGTNLQNIPAGNKKDV